jgi:mannose-1-phosphate guanylyltransferase
MEAMILAAGKGTRLLPLTLSRPKPLFPILNQPLLTLTLSYLSRFGLERVLLNTHHLAAQVEAFVQREQAAGNLEIETIFEPQILGTGGGIGQTQDFWKSDFFLVINGDIVTDIDLVEALAFHRSHGGPVTLILHDYPAFNQIAMDRQGCIRRFRQEKGLAFTGIHLLDRAIFDYLPSFGSYDIIPVYQKMIDEGRPIRAYVSQGHYWRDMGTPESYLTLHEEGLSGKESFLLPFLDLGSADGAQGLCLHPQAKIEKGAVLSGWAAVGKGSLLKKGCHVRNSVLWEGAVVEPGVTIDRSIVGAGARVTGDLLEGVVV